MIKLPILFNTNVANEMIECGIDMAIDENVLEQEVWLNPSALVSLHTVEKDYTSISMMDGEIYTCPMPIDKVKKEMLKYKKTTKLCPKCNRLKTVNKLKCICGNIKEFTESNYERNKVRR